MTLTLGQIAGVTDSLAPFRLAYDWDNVGLQIGDPAAAVKNLLVALEVNADSIAFARAKKCEAILSHHPLIFQPARVLRADDPTQRLVMELIRHGIGLIAAHTNLDRVMRGTNGAMAEILGLRDLSILEPVSFAENFKLTVFVPREYTAKLIEAIHRGGGGRIGNYTHCTFRAAGTGTYIPGEGASPFAGIPGEFEQAHEDRLEAIVPKGGISSVLREVRQAHPYEEVAYDLYPLHDAEQKFGLGVVGALSPKSTVGKIAGLLHERCTSQLTTIIGSPNAEVRKVAIVTGSAGSTIRKISPATADVLVTGELSYHFGVEAKDRGLNVVMVGHAASEKIFADYFKAELAKNPTIAKSGLTIHTFSDYPDPMLPIAAPIRRKGKRA
ncbi:MAG: Nif3-like dinuclear metal center hexameric protein [Candidatus Sumerlaeaceae bacterium]|nr:Nif3-like dinuclear metal center hexameric protein [Candidatus Sumerlaeaceae bacterium]